MSRRALWITYIAIFVALTLLTQVGGVIFILALFAARWLPATWHGWKRGAATTIIFVFLYQALSATVVPTLAAIGGRVPLPCYADTGRPFAAGSRLYCILNRHYVDSRLVTLLTALSQSLDRDRPGTITLYLDGNFPFVDGFPLLPHLSHNDGRKLDLAYYYYASPDKTYLPGRMRSSIGYWAFEQPGAGEKPSCTGRSLLTMRWDMSFLRPFHPDRPLEPQRTAAALRWLADEGPKFELERVFIEPYLAQRLGVSSPLFGFQGCRAARHDDHIHIQITP